MFDVTGGIAGVGVTPQWHNLGAGCLEKDLPCLIVKTVR